MKLLAQRREELSLAFGGQALIEGIMFRSRIHMVMCVRQPDNEIMTFTEEISSMTKRYRFLGLPFIRGIVSMFETFYLGVKGLYFSANAVLEEEEKFTYKEFMISVAMALVLASIFFITPFLLTTMFNLTGVVFNVVESILRLTIFLVFLTLVARWSEYKRILQYHGAEHKTVNAFEAGVALNVVNVQKFSRLHPRCGTSFIFVVMLVSIILFSIMPKLGFIARLTYRILLIPLIGAISYELLMLSNRYRKSIITRILIMPGLALQHLTTKDPDDDMMEVAVKAAKEIIRLSDRPQKKLNLS